METDDKQSTLQLKEVKNYLLGIHLLVADSLLIESAFLGTRAWGKHIYCENV